MMFKLDRDKQSVDMEDGQLVFKLRLALKQLPVV